MNKTIHAVLDNYHEGIFPVIAICKTHKSAEKFVNEKIAIMKQMVTIKTAGVTEEQLSQIIEVEEGLLSDSNGDTQKMF